MSLIFDATSFSPHNKQLTGESCGPVLACQETHSCSFEEGAYRYDLEVGKKRCFIHNDVCSFTYYMFQIYQKNKLMKALGEELELILNAFSVLFNYISSFTPSISKNISYLENTEKLLHKMTVVIFGIRLGTFVLF